MYHVKKTIYQIFDEGISTENNYVEAKMDLEYENHVVRW